MSSSFSAYPSSGFTLEHMQSANQVNQSFEHKCHKCLHKVKQSKRVINLSLKHLKLHTANECSAKPPLYIFSLALCFKGNVKMNSLVFAKHSYLYCRKTKE